MMSVLLYDANAQETTRTILILIDAPPADGVRYGTHQQHSSGTSFYPSIYICIYIFLLLTISSRSKSYTAPPVIVGTRTTAVGHDTATSAKSGDSIIGDTVVGPGFRLQGCAWQVVNEWFKVNQPPSPKGCVANGERMD